jgi:hypothetical protein
MGVMIADSVVALIVHAQSSVASVRMTSKSCRHARDDTPLDEDEEKKKLEPDALRFICSVLKEQFQNVEAVYEGFKSTYEIITDAGSNSITLWQVQRKSPSSVQIMCLYPTFKQHSKTQ